MENLFKWSNDGMKMIIKSGYGLFNRQTNLITEGNCISNTQYSMSIRPYTETKVNGLERPLGYLQDYDLSEFETSKMDNNFLDYIKSFKNSITLYEFYVYRKINKDDEYRTKDIIGWLVVSNNEIVAKEVCDYYRQKNNAQRKKALDLCDKIISKDIEEIYNVK